MKVLILKTNQFLSREAVEQVVESVELGIQNGYLILDAHFDYEVADIERIQYKAPVFEEGEQNAI